MTTLWPSGRKTLGYPALLVAGLAALYLPIHTQLELDDWAAHLRATGVPARGFVYDLTSTMHFRYEVGGRQYEEIVSCPETCLLPGESIAIWVNPADHTDFVTGLGTLSGSRGGPQGLVGFVGFVAAVAGGYWTVRRFRPPRPWRTALIDGRRSFTDGRTTEAARTSAEGIALLERYRERRLDELWLDCDLGADDEIWPVVKVLEDAAFEKRRIDIGLVNVYSASPLQAAKVARVLRHWAYHVEVVSASAELRTMSAV
ncbi:cyclic-phosphate processing receiver domain-containing protein [Actinoplanes regularis]|uniref:cyclic-phosphate processing receiver domain-containing protein n=1 Tax=Actinoplanes regularis TaxID=52697 RepID=UPI0024A5CDB7|nr:hypothetical protein Areg01_14380 [Actinoplanes regularis]